MNAIVKMLTAVVLLISLSACGSPDSKEWHALPSNASAIIVKLPDNRDVICVVYDDASYGTNLSCDWEHAN